MNLSDYPLCDIARIILARLLVDVERCGGPLVARNNAAGHGEGLHSGPWGTALAYAELSRVDSALRWRRAAASLATVDHSPSGRGVFTGSHGKQIALAAVSGDPVDIRPTRCRVRGDLMDGTAGEVWSPICLGGPPLARANAKTQEIGRGDDLGLAHGMLGALLNTPVAITPSRLEDIRERMRQVGWCNGSTGVAAIALLFHQWDPSDAFLHIAQLAITQSLDGSSDLITDGLCHGTIGIFVVAAGVARARHDLPLLLEVRSHAAEVCSRAVKRGWRLDDQRLVDQSWLTGSAGIAWGLLAVDKQPLINPLSPADAAIIQG